MNEFDLAVFALIMIFLFLSLEEVILNCASNSDLYWPDLASANVFCILGSWVWFALILINTSPDNNRIIGTISLMICALISLLIRSRLKRAIRIRLETEFEDLRREIQSLEDSIFDRGIRFRLDTSEEVPLFDRAIRIRLETEIEDLSREIQCLDNSIFDTKKKPTDI